MKTEKAIETTMACQELKKLAVGEVCSYKSLKAAIDKDPQNEGYPYVFSARRIVERELHCVFAAVPNEGIRRLPPRGVINLGGKDLRGIRRRVHVGIRRQVTVVPIEQQGDLSLEEKLKFQSQLSMFGLVKALMGRRTITRIESAVQTSGQVVESREAIKMLVASRRKKVEQESEPEAKS